jgi:DNA mismatch repair ATPase MutS
MEQDIINNYRQRVLNAQEQVNKYKKLVNTYSLMRLCVFGLFIAAASVAIMQNNFNIIAIAFVIMLLCFAWLVSKQSGFEIQRKYFEHLVKVNENEIASISSHDNIYDNGARFANEKHYYSSDLDIFGPASLYQLINRAATVPGINKLGGWLNAPAPKPTVLLRQDAVKELAAKNDWKLDVQASLYFAKTEDTDQLKRLFTYLALPLNLPGEKWLGTYAKIAPWLLSAAIIGAFFSSYAKDLAVLIGFINMALVFSKAEYIKKTSMIADKIGETLAGYAQVFKKAEEQQWESARCRELAQVLIAGKTSARIKDLSILINKLNYHLNIIVGFLLNVFFIWDIRQIIAIENWKRDNHESLEAAFEVIAEFEALISLASVHINYPEWVFPQIADGDGYTLTATNLAHPLIYPKNRVDNDYELNEIMS